MGLLQEDNYYQRFGFSLSADTGSMFRHLSYVEGCLGSLVQAGGLTGRTKRRIKKELDAIDVAKRYAFGSDRFRRRYDALLLKQFGGSSEKIERCAHAGSEAPSAYCDAVVRASAVLERVDSVEALNAVRSRRKEPSGSGRRGIDLAFESKNAFDAGDDVWARLWLVDARKSAILVFLPLSQTVPGTGSAGAATLGCFVELPPGFDMLGGITVQAMLVNHTKGRTARVKDYVADLYGKSCAPRRTADESPRPHHAQSVQKDTPPAPQTETAPDRSNGKRGDDEAEIAEWLKSFGGF